MGCTRSRINKTKAIRRPDKPPLNADMNFHRFPKSRNRVRSTPHSPVSRIQLNSPHRRLHPLSEPSQRVPRDVKASRRPRPLTSYPQRETPNLRQPIERDRRSTPTSHFPISTERGYLPQAHAKEHTKIYAGCVVSTVGTGQTVEAIHVSNPRKHHNLLRSFASPNPHLSAARSRAMSWLGCE